AAPVEVPQHGGEIDAGGIHHRFLRNLEVRRHGQQLAADGADARIELAGIDERLDEVRQEQDVRVEGEDPIPTGKLDRLILGGGEAYVLVIVVDAAAILELLENIEGSVA